MITLIFEKSLKPKIKNMANINKEETGPIIIICFKNFINYFDLNQFEEKNITKKYESLEKLNIINLFKIDCEEYLICCENKVILFSNLFNDIKDSHVYYIDLKYVKSGILINKDYVALKVCNISSNKENGIYFYYIKKNEIINKNIKNKEYSFIYSTNGLVIMPKKEIDTDNKILLCACKKYLKNQKNGILLVNIEIKNNNIDFDHYFYETGKFEVYCFCPILIGEKEKFLDNSNIKDTNYFLVGGFDLNKNKGIIKLYKVIYGKKYYDNRIEYIQDIILDNSIIENEKFVGFRAPITCIIQVSSNYKDFLITCWDGNIYLLSSLDISYYLNYDKLIQNNTSIKKFFKK